MSEPIREENIFTGNPMDMPENLVTRLNETGLGIEDLCLAREISRLACAEPDQNINDALVLIILAAQLSAAEGNTRLAIDRGKLPGDLCNILNCDPSLLETVEKLLHWFCEVEEGLIRPEIIDLVGQPGDYKPLIVEQGRLYFQKLYVLENRVASMLQQKLYGKIHMKCNPIIKTALQEVLNQQPLGPDGRKTCLDSEQERALETALEGKLTIISGRPGSGKTSIVTSLLRVMYRTGMNANSIALAAPTGKAADRMRQSIARQLSALDNSNQADMDLALSPPPASTVHRLLGYSPALDRFRYNENNPLLEDLVIVDESSMLDLYLADSLLRALKDDTMLVLLGDADQLPSIETGSVLRDLCRSEHAAVKSRVVVLEKSYRVREDEPSGQAILSLAEAVNRGQTLTAEISGSLLTERSKAEELSFSGSELLVPGRTGARTVFFKQWLDKMQQNLPGLIKLTGKVYRYDPEGFDDSAKSDLGVLFEHYDRFRMLCVTRLPAGGTGSEPVNEWFHQHWQEILKKNNHSVYRGLFYNGEPVMINRNDYRLQLYNGDSGLILKVAIAGEEHDGSSTLMAIFPHNDNYIAYPLALLRNRLELAWATTVHKAQGSEYGHIALLLPDQPVRPLTRELIYTAITRAKTSVIICGSKEVLQEGINRVYDRDSGLTDRLA